MLFYYNSPLDPQNRYSEGQAIYSQVDDKYVITDHRVSPNHDDKFNTLFPRMWSTMEESHANDYIEWGKIKGTRVQHTNERGENEVIIKPTFTENLRFFFSYHVNHMYWRYFMWNFVGRQNDIQSHGSVIHGNWLSGINFIDEARLGPQTNLPENFDNNARNKFYLLPFILGFIGLVFIGDADDFNAAYFL